MQFLKELKQQKYPIRFILSRVLIKTGLSNLFLIKKDNYFLRFNSSNLSAKMWIDRQYGWSEEFFFKKYLKEGDIVVDVGANIGSLSLAASIAVGKKGKVYAIEPHPKTFEYLEENIRLNQANNLSTFNYALSNKQSELFISNKMADDMNHVIKNGSNTSNLKVKTVMLDDLPIYDKVSLLKVDVEGYEKFVFEGGKRVIENSEFVYFEVIKKYCSRYKYNLEELIYFLKQYSFHIFVMSEPEILCEILEYSTIEKTMLYAIKDTDNFQHRTGYTLITE